jgi:hypothetical protein
LSGGSTIARARARAHSTFARGVPNASCVTLVRVPGVIARCWCSTIAGAGRDVPMPRHQADAVMQRLSRGRRYSPTA